VLARPELGIRKGIRQQLLTLIKNHSHIVSPLRRIEVSSDPDDNMFLECADAAHADYLITGTQTSTGEALLTLGYKSLIRARLKFSIAHNQS
jgi:putative PIN family toxin of toxin-antitoxin system